MNKIEINIPEGFEIDNEKSNFSKGIIEFKPVEKKKLSYGDIANQLFKDSAFWVGSEGLIREYVPINTKSAPNNSTSREQLECLMAYNKLRNVAEYLNKGYDMPWDEISFHWVIVFSLISKKLMCLGLRSSKGSEVYFASKELAEQAISILGEEEIKKALFIY